MVRDHHNFTSAPRADSESDIQDQTPDTDDSGAHSYPEISSSGTFAVTAGGSFKRTPVMGNRCLEQRGKKSKTYPPKEAIIQGVIKLI